MCVSDALHEPPAADVLDDCKSFARFLLVGVLTNCVFFLGIVTLCNDMGWPDALHNIVCFLGSAFNFLLTRCVMSCSSCLDNGCLEKD